MKKIFNKMFLVAGVGTMILAVGAVMGAKSDRSHVVL